MNKIRTYLLSLTGAALLSAAFAPVSVAADFSALDKPAERQWLPQPDLRQDWAQNQITAGQAKAIAQRQVPGGKFLDIKLTGNVYRVRFLMPDGRRVDVRVDARTGDVR